MQRLFIEGEWTEAQSKETFDSLNPADGEVLDTVHSAGLQDVEKAIGAARDSYHDWTTENVTYRAELLRKYLYKLREEKENIIELVTKEAGKTLAESRGEVEDALNLIDYLVGEGKRYFGYVAPSTQKNRLAYTQRCAYGVAALLTPWNFPVSILAWKMAPALLCGNTVVIKPSSETPLTAGALVSCAEDIFPSGVINLVTGRGKAIGDRLISHRWVDIISFTGSTEIGRKIRDGAGLKEVGLELGGKNPALIMPSTDIKKAVEDTVKGAFGVAGQRCTATSRVIVHEDIIDEFRDALLERTKGLTVGNGMDAETDMGPLINESHAGIVHSYVEEAVEEGGRLLCGGKALERTGNYYLPTVLDGLSTEMRIAQEEVFGPVLCLFACSSFDEGVEIANDVPYGLSASIYTADLEEAFRGTNELASGIVVVNNPPGAVEAHLPFGGVKESGIGREGGIEGIDEFSRTKTVYIDY